MAKQNLLDKVNNKIIDTGKSVVKKLNKRIDRKQRHKATRKKIMGEEGMIRQDMRETQAKVRGALKKGDSVTKAKGRQAVKRVGEYRAAKKATARMKRMNTPLARAVAKKKRAASDKKSKAQFESRSKAKQHKTDF
jgi:hypothetical protein